MGEFVLTRPRAKITITSLKGFLASGGAFTDISGSAVDGYEVTGLNLITKTVRTDTPVYDTLDGDGANAGYVFPPAVIEGSVNIIINDPQTPLVMRQMIDSCGVCDIRVTETTEPSGGYDVLRDVVITGEDYDLAQAVTELPTIRYSFRALTLERYAASGGEPLFKVGDGWERMSSGATRPSGYYTAW